MNDDILVLPPANPGAEVNNFMNKEGVPCKFRISLPWPVMRRCIDTFNLKIAAFTE